MKPPSGSKPVFIAFCYLPPENSNFYTKNDVHLFQCLEENIGKYLDEGTVYVTGDMNERCSDRCDFIENDLLNKYLMDNLQPLTDYDLDQNYSRNSMDTVVNQFGRKLITLCKTTGFRIFNGRHNKDINGSFTFFGPNGMSMIDYLLVHHSQIDSILDFSSGKFNTLSDHAPICFTFTIDRLSDDTPTCDNHNAGRAQARSVKWNEENTEVIYNLLLEQIEHINSTVDVNIENADDMNTCVQEFTDVLTRIILPHCNVT